MSAQQEVIRPSVTESPDPSANSGNGKAPRAREMNLQLANGMRIAAKHWGSPKNPIKVMALHGWLDNAGTWDGLAPMLVQHNIEFVALDFIGHGKSSHLPREADPTFLAYVVQVLDAAQALGWSSFHLLAHSMGAAVASIVAGTVPSLVESAVLVEALGPLSSEAPAVETLEQAVADRVKYLNRKPKLYSSVDDCVKKLRQNNPDIAEHSAKAIVKRGTLNVEGGIMFAHDPRLVGKSLIRFREGDVLGFLKRIRCPVLSVWTKATIDNLKKQKANRREEKQAAPTPSPSTPTATTPTTGLPSNSSPSSQPDILSEEEARARRLPSAAEIMQNRIRAVPHLKLLVVPGSHHVHADAPEAIFEEVLHFLNRPKPKL